MTIKLSIFYNVKENKMIKERYKNMKIAWIGTGVMGKPMVSHLVDSAYEIAVYVRSEAKIKGLHPAIKVYTNLEECVKDADFIFSIVGYPKDVLELYEKIFKVAKEGAILIDMTTSSPTLAVQLHEQAHLLGLRMLDAPVTGGEIGAIKGTLTVMVGGCESAYEKVYSILKFFGKTINYVGEAGSGQRTKSVNQIAIAGSLLGTIEALVVAMENYLDLNTVYSIVGNGSAASWQLQTNGKKIIDGDFKPGFYIKHFLKDLKIAQESTQYNLRGLNTVIDMLERLVEYNYADEGTQSLIMYYLDKKISKFNK